jgi:hypothetical protein
MPLADYAQLGKALGGGIYGQEIINAMAAEADALDGSDSERVAREALVRAIHNFRPQGWGEGPLVDSRQVSVLVQARETGGRKQRVAVELAWRSLRNNDVEPGWLPQTADDEILRSAWESGRTSTAKVTRILRLAARAPWGDYGRMLIHGMANRQPDGTLEVSRCGPLVPPVFLPAGTRSLVLRDSVITSFEQCLGRGRLSVVSKRKIVTLNWERWDRSAFLPEQRPPDGEPENYIVRGVHSAAMNEQVGPLWEAIVTSANPHVDEVSHAIYTTPKAVGILVGTAVAAWLAENAGEWVVIEEDHLVE